MTEGIAELSLGTSALGNVIEAVTSMLCPYAKLGELERENRYGVEVLMPNGKHPDHMMCRFVTPDGFLVNLKIEFKKLSRKYLDNMLYDLKVKLGKHLFEKQEKERIYLTAPAGEKITFISDPPKAEQ